MDSDNCRLVLFGDFKLEKDTSYNNSVQQTVHNKILSYSKNNPYFSAIDNILNNTTNCNELNYITKSFTDVPNEYLSEFFGNFYSIDKVKEKLAAEKYETLAFNVTNYKTPQDQFKAGIVITFLIGTFIMFILIFYILLDYQTHKSKVEYLIHQFYGANYKHIILRSFIYYSSLFILTTLLLSLLKLQGIIFVGIYTFILFVVLSFLIIKQLKGA